MKFRYVAKFANNQVGAIVTSDGPAQEGPTLTRATGGAYRTPSAAAFAISATAAPYTVQVSVSEFPLSSPVTGPGAVNTGQVSDEPSTPEMGNSIGESNEFLRNLSTLK